MCDEKIPTTVYKQEYLSKNDNNSNNIIYIINELLLQFDKNAITLSTSDQAELLSKIVKIFSSKEHAEILFFLRREGAATILTIRREFPHVEWRRVYRIVEDLLITNIITKVQKIKGYKEEGRRPVVYQYLNTDPENVVNAIKQHRLLSTPGYQEALRIKQLILEEYLSPREKKEISKLQIVSYCRSKCSKAFNIFDISLIVEKELHNEGIIIIR